MRLEYNKLINPDYFPCVQAVLSAVSGLQSGVKSLDQSMYHVSIAAFIKINCLLNFRVHQPMSPYVHVSFMQIRNLTK